MRTNEVDPEVDPYVNTRNPRFYWEEHMLCIKEIDEIDQIANMAIKEAALSNMPGRGNGPADAYRHVLLAAELTRRFGETKAAIILGWHEFTGSLGWRSFA